jgi:hypothetical protein
LPLLHIDDAPGFGSGDKQIGLAAEKCGNLQYVHGLRHGRALCRFMHIREHRQAERVADFREYRQSRLHADATRAPARGAVRLVEGRLVDEAHLQPAGDLLERRGHFQRVRPALHLAGPRDQRERKRVAKTGFADGNG